MSGEPVLTRPTHWQAVLFNSGALLAERALRLVIGQLVITALLARYLGPEQFGLLQWAAAIVALGAALAGLGLEEILVRELVCRAPDAQARVMASAARLKAGGAVLAALAAIGMAAALRWGAPAQWGLVAILAVGLLCSPWDVIDGWLQSRGKFRPAVAARLGGFAASTVLKLTLVWGRAPLWTIAAATAAEAAVAAIGLGWIGRRAGIWPCWRNATGGEMRWLLAEGGPLVFSGLFVLLTMQADKVIVAQLAGNATAGYYAAAARITELFYAVPVALGAAAAPMLARRRAGDRRGYWRSVRRMALGFAGAGLLAAGLIAWRADEVVRMLFGGRFAAASGPLAVHVWSLVFIFLVSWRGRVLVLEGRSSWVAWLAGATAMMNLGLNLWLVPRWGAMGAAWAATASWGFSALLAPLFLPRMGPMLREFFGGSRPA